MNHSLLDEVFSPPKLETGARVLMRGDGILGRRRGTVVRAGGWFAVIRWDGNPQPRREYIPDIEVENS